MGVWKVVGIIVALSALASCIVFLSVMAASGNLHADLDTVVDLVMATGITVLIGGALVTILAICFTYNKPDPDSFI